MAYSLPTMTLTATEELVVVQLPASLAMEERHAVVARMISTLRRVPTSHLAVVELVYNIIQMCMPGLADTLGTTTSVKLVTVSPTKEQVLRWVGLDDGEGQVQEIRLPRLPGAPAPEAAAVTGQVAVHVAAASLLFAIGRQASESARTSALDKRPDALIRRFNVAEGDQVLLPGREAGPSRESLEAVYNGFANYSEIRANVIKALIVIRKGEAHLPLGMEIIMTNFNLMRGAGMTHVEAMIQLARMHPWTLSYPKLEPYWAKFMKELTAFEQVPPEIRPYHRLVVNQSHYLFLSSEYRPLVAVAGSFIEEVEKTFSGYVYNKGTYQELIDDVRSYVPGYNPTNNLTQLAKLLNVKTVDLPERQEQKESTKVTTV